jgi:hypothetical protein
MKAIVGYSEYGDRHEDQHGDGRWDYSWSENLSYSFDGFLHIYNDDEEPAEYISGERMIVSDDIREGDTVYYVWVSCSYGDSFGNGTGRMCEIGIYKDINDARAVVAAIEADEKAVAASKRAKTKKEAKALMSHRDKDGDLVVNGQKIYTYPWQGHFERYEETRIETLSVIRVDNVKKKKAKQ